MKAIIVTGVPGTGKTTFAKNLAEKYKLAYTDVNQLIAKHNLSVGRDKKRDCEIIDTDTLKRVLEDEIKDSSSTMVIDSHLSQCIGSEFVKICFVTKCDIRELKKRLEKRGYSKEKVRENLDAEIFDVCLVEANELSHRTEIINTDKVVDYNKLERFI